MNGVICVDYENRPRYLYTRYTSLLDRGIAEMGILAIDEDK